MAEIVVTKKGKSAENYSAKDQPSSLFFCLKFLFIMAHIFAFMLCAFIIFLSQPGTSLFSWHPTLMVLGFGLFMFEAILLFSPYSSLLGASDRKLKVKYHWILQVLAAICFNLGFAVIYYNKNLNNKPHFTSWHGKIGFWAVAISTFQTMVGPSLIYYNNRILNPMGTSLALRKKVHGVVGALAFVLGDATMILSLFSNFMVKNTSETSWYFLLILKTIMASVVVNQASSKYVFKSK
eukprot:TCONS_00005315-protein